MKVDKKRRYCILGITLLLFICCGALPAQEGLKTENFNILDWRHIGPWNFSGRFSHVAVPAGQSLKYYVAAATGGIFKTENGGLSFTPIFEHNGNQSIGYIAISPSNPDILYVGTGEALHARASYHGNGMWKSVDAGKTWQKIGLEETYYIPKVMVHPQNPDIVYVAAEGKLYSNNKDCQRGLYKTSDGGKNWKRILDLKDRGVGDFDMDLHNPDTLIACAYRIFRRTYTFMDRQHGNGFYKTTDGGENWKELKKGLPQGIKTGRNGVDIHDKKPNVVIIRLDQPINVGLPESDGAAKYREPSEWSAGNLFEEDAYFNKLKGYVFSPSMARLTSARPFEAKDDLELAQKINECIMDRDFLDKSNIDIDTFVNEAERLLSQDESGKQSVMEIRRTLARGREKASLPQEVNALFFYALLADNEGISYQQDLSIEKPEKLTIQPELLSLLAFQEEDGIPDSQSLLKDIQKWRKDPELTVKLKIKPEAFDKKIKECYKDKPQVLTNLAQFKDLLEEHQETRGRYQTINRFVIQTLYHGLLTKLEPVEKAGVIYRSEDGGEQFKAMTEYRLVGGSDVLNQVEAGYNGRITMDPSNDQIIYGHETLDVKSEDGGKTFRQTKWYQKGVHVDTRFIWVDPDNGQHLILANDGGISETWDGGNNWSQKATIPAQQFYDVSVDQDMPYNIMGGTQDNGCWFGPSQNRNQNGVYPADWNYLPSGDGFYVVRNWWNPEFIYFESQFGSSRRKNLISGEITSLAKRNTPKERAMGTPRHRYQWDAPIFLSPHNPGIVFVCSQHVNRSMSRGNEGSFQVISPDLSKNDKKRQKLSKETNLQYGTITTFAESPKTPGIYWAGTDDGNLWFSSNHGASWESITDRFYSRNGAVRKGSDSDRIPFDRWVARVTPSFHDEHRCYVAFTGYRTHDEDTAYLYVTSDNGRSWTRLASDLNSQINDIEEDPENPDVLYLGCDSGLFVSMDRGLKWTRMNNQMPHVIIKDLAVQKRERELVVASYGRGIYIIDIAPLAEMNQDNLQKDAWLFTPQRGVIWNRHESRGEQYGTIARSANPPLGTTLYYRLGKPAKSVRIDIQDCSGKTINSFKGNEKAGIHKILWDYTQAKKKEQQSSRRRGPDRVEPATYTVILIVDNQECSRQLLPLFSDPSS